MSVRNKMWKLLLYIGVRILSVISLFLLAMFVTSPILCIIISIADKLNTLPAIVQGRVWLAWILLSIPFLIGFYIHTEVKLYKSRKSIREKERQKEQQK